MKRSKSSKLKNTFSKLLRKPSGKSGKHSRQEQLTSSKVVPIASSSDAHTNGDAVYDAVAEWKTGPLQHHPGMNDTEVKSLCVALRSVTSACIASHRFSTTTPSCDIHCSKCTPDEPDLW